MKKFKSMATKDGKKYEGTFEAIDEEDARKKLIAQGFDITSLEEVAEPEASEGFADSVIEEAWERAGGRCECKSSTHGHMGQCIEIISKEDRGDASKQSSWEIRRINESEGYALSNCEIVCRNCYEKPR